jgi:hypothetical protein
MSTGLSIRDSLGLRRVERADFPLSIGGRGCALQLDSGAGAPLAWLGLHEEGLFLQPAAPGALLHNGQPLQQSAWLHAGDVITAGSASMRLGLEHGVRTLLVSDTGVGNSTAPPALADRERQSGGTEGAPEALKTVQYRARMAASREGAAPRKHAAPWGTLAAALAVVAVLWYLAAGVAVQLSVSPGAAHLRVEGGTLTPHIGGQLFVMPGHYALVAEAPGYATQRVAFQVTRAAGQTVAVRMIKLPGRLHVIVPASGSLQVDSGKSLAVPAVLELAAGSHHLSLSVSGYLPWNGDLNVQGEGRDQTLAPDLVANSVRNLSARRCGSIISSAALHLLISDWLPAATRWNCAWVASSPGPSTCW